MVAVADGVSAASQPHIGSTLACRYAVDWCARNLGNPGSLPDWTSLVEEAAWALVEAAGSTLRRDDATSADAEGLFATTLVVAVLRPSRDDGSPPSATLLAVGDSGAWLLRKNDYCPLVGGKVVGSDGLSSSAVSGLPRVPSEVQPVTVELRPDDVLLVGTDGFGDPLGDGDGLVGGTFARHLREPPSPLGFAFLLDFSRDTFDDDRTLVGVWPSRH